jgi:hypothetical protein
MKNSVQIGRNFLQRQVVVLVAMRATRFVKLFACGLLVGKPPFGMASCQTECQRQGECRAVSERCVFPCRLVSNSQKNGEIPPGKSCVSIGWLRPLITSGPCF